MNDMTVVIIVYASVCSLCFADYSLFTLPVSFFFFFNDTATTEIYTLSLHDALPIYVEQVHGVQLQHGGRQGHGAGDLHEADRKSTRLNSSHLVISYAVFCLKKKNK